MLHLQTPSHQHSPTHIFFPLPLASRGHGDAGCHDGRAGGDGLRGPAAEPAAAAET